MHTVIACYVRTLASLRNRLAPAADTQGWGRARERNSKDTPYVCCCNAFKIVLALSLVDRRSSPLTRQGGHVLQHRQPGASLRFVESIQRSDHRTAAKRPLSLCEKGHHAGGAETPHWGLRQGRYLSRKAGSVLYPEWYPDISGMPAAYELAPRRRLTRKRSTEHQPPLWCTAPSWYAYKCASIRLAAQLAAPRRLHDDEARETAQ